MEQAWGNQAITDAYSRFRLRSRIKQLTKCGRAGFVAPNGFGETFRMKAGIEAMAGEPPAQLTGYRRTWRA